MYQLEIQRSDALRTPLAARLGAALLALVALAAASVAQADTVSTTLYFSGDCSDCTGTATASLTIPSFTTGVQNAVPASFTYSSNLAGNLSATASASDYLFEAYIDPTTLSPSGYAFIEYQFTATDINGAVNTFTFFSCGANSGASLGGIATCGTAAQVAAGSAMEVYGSWALTEGSIYAPSSGLPGGVGGKQADYGTNGLWSTAAPQSSLAAGVTAAPELDAGSMSGALTLLIGALTVLRGRYSGDGRSAAR